MIVYTEAEQLLIHRVKRFEALGLSYPEALELAAAGVEVHNAEDMVDAGCSPELLAKILL